MKDLISQPPKITFVSLIFFGKEYYILSHLKWGTPHSKDGFRERKQFCHFMNNYQNQSALLLLHQLVWLSNN